MSQYNWPHPAYAEDQPYAKQLLYVHVFHRGFEVGAGFGILNALYKIRKISRLNQSIASSSTPVTSSTTTAKTATSLLRPISTGQIFWSSIAKGSLIGGCVTMVLLTGRMWGLQEIEWQDRSWRLLENKGQVMHDRYCDWGAGLGALTTVVANRGVRQLWSLEMAGRAGLGALVGAIACEVVRNTWKEDKSKK